MPSITCMPSTFEENAPRGRVPGPPRCKVFFQSWCDNGHFLKTLQKNLSTAWSVIIFDSCLAVHLANFVPRLSKMITKCRHPPPVPLFCFPMGFHKLGNMVQYITRDFNWSKTKSTIPILSLDQHSPLALLIFQTPSVSNPKATLF